MTNKPIKAAELVQRTRNRLSRYGEAPPTLTELRGVLEDVETTGENDALIIVRPVDGLGEHEMATATIRKPAPETDRLLERIGRNGRITLVGMASTGSDSLARVVMREVRTINGKTAATTGA
jgi:hypothetical protein